MTALQTLTATIRKLDETQTRISTGLRVGKAEDNAAYWSIATTMRSDNGALSTVKDALGLGSATIDVAYTGMNSAIESVTEIKNKLVAARQPGVDRGKIQSEITELQRQLTSIGATSVFSGENWISVDSSAPGYNATKTIVASFSRSSGSISIGTISVNVEDVKLFDAGPRADDHLGRYRNDRDDDICCQSWCSEAESYSAEGLRVRLNGCDHARCWRPGGCGHERGIDEASGVAGPTAARCTVAQYRKSEQSEHTLTLQGIA